MKIKFNKDNSTFTMGSIEIKWLNKFLKDDCEGFYHLCLNKKELKNIDMNGYNFSIVHENKSFLITDSVYNAMCLLGAFFYSNQHIKLAVTTSQPYWIIHDLLHVKHDYDTLRGSISDVNHIEEKSRHDESFEIMRELGFETNKELIISIEESFKRDFNEIYNAC